MHIYVFKHHITGNFKYFSNSTGEIQNLLSSFELVSSANLLPSTTILHSLFWVEDGTPWWGC